MSASAEVAAERWFGAAFAGLAPELRRLHRHGGVLRGDVRFVLADGVAGWLGRIALHRLGIRDPQAAQPLSVEIRPAEAGLVWSRRFGDGPEARSLFVPEGHWPDGVWRERAGPFELALGVDIADGGWRWRQRACRCFGVALPSWLAPRVEAGKRVVGERYRFDVAIVLPVFGRVLAWGGDLGMAS